MPNQTTATIESITSFYQTFRFSDGSSFLDFNEVSGEFVTDNLYTANIGDAMDEFIPYIEGPDTLVIRNPFNNSTVKISHIPSPLSVLAKLQEQYHPINYGTAHGAQVSLDRDTRNHTKHPYPVEISKHTLSNTVQHLIRRIDLLERSIQHVDLDNHTLNEYWVKSYLLEKLLHLSTQDSVELLANRFIINGLAGCWTSTDQNKNSDPQLPSNRIYASSKRKLERNYLFLDTLRSIRPDITSFELRLASASITCNNKRRVSLKDIYPDLIPALKGFYELFSKNTTLNQRDIAQIIWPKFNEIKSTLMLLGYSEKVSARTICRFIPKESMFSKRIGVCEITKQIIPEGLLAPVRLLSAPDKTLLANIAYLNYINSTVGRHRFAFNSDTQEFIEQRMPDADYSLTNIHRSHTFNVLSFLSPRFMSGENVKATTGTTAISHYPFLGVELEVERKEGSEDKVYCIERIHDKVYDLLGRDFVILKHDGSLRGHRPFEIVTVPATLAYHQTQWEDFLSDQTFRPQLTSYASGRCGMHIHINRHSFTGLHLAKFMRFINAKVNSKFINTIAQRYNNDFAKYHDTTIAAHKHNYVASYSNPTRTTRMSAVNCNNKATIEVRIFRGNLSKTGFFKNLEFVHALWYYTKYASIAELEYKAFIRWLFDPINDSHEYKHLKAWLIGSKYNVSNIIIRATESEDKRARLLDERKKIKQIQGIIKRKYALTNSPDTTLKFGQVKAISAKELTTSI